MCEHVLLITIKNKNNNNIQLTINLKDHGVLFFKFSLKGWHQVTLSAVETWAIIH